MIAVNQSAMSMRNEHISVDEMRLAIHQRHDCRAGEVLQIARVAIARRNAAEWRGEVHVFTISGNPRASECSAWPEPVDERTVIIHTVLHCGRVHTPEEAVRSVLSRR